MSLTPYEAVIGLEVHAQLLTQSKVFCRAPNSFGQEANSQVGVVSLGLPGSLPVLNKKAVELAVRAGLSLNCKINTKSVFSRKNYFYPDLPKGYQISQFDEPICLDGFIEIPLDRGGTKRISIERIHMEEDAGKSIHMASSTLINLNRAGVPLVEIVTKPDLRHPSEAVAYLKKLHAILIYAGVCDGNLEEGNFRCDANVSVRPLGQQKLGTRTELKNINSFKFIEKAIEYEIARHIAVIEGGGRIIQETRGWDAAAAKTFLMRTKEEAQDYRYFPDPDLPPLVLSKDYIDSIARELPELPDPKRARYVKDLGLTEYDAEVLTSEKEYAHYFERCVFEGAPPKLAANWIISEVLREIKTQEGLRLSEVKLSPSLLAKLLILLEKGTISGKIAKIVFEEMWIAGEDPDLIIQKKGLSQVSDSSTVDAWVDQVLLAHPESVESYRSGKTKLFGFFVGEVMKLSKGKANPQLVSESIRKKLEGA